jgi:hypothetical protein
VRYHRTVVVSRAVTVGLLAACAACSAKVASRVADAPGSNTPTDAGSATDDGAISGTRLKLIYWTFADGTTTWDAFYDEQRREDCSIGSWSGGSIYCYPNNWASVVYTNSTCSDAVGQWYSDPSCPSPAPGYVLDFTDDGCTSLPDHLYVRGAKQTVASYYFLDSTGACDGPYTDGGYDDYYALGAEVPTSELVGLTVTSPGGAASSRCAT